MGVGGEGAQKVTSLGNSIGEFFQNFRECIKLTF